jgi:hypothetical protein
VLGCPAPRDGSVQRCASCRRARRFPGTGWSMRVAQFTASRRQGADRQRALLADEGVILGSGGRARAGNGASLVTAIFLAAAPHKHQHATNTIAGSPIPADTMKNST